MPRSEAPAAPKAARAKSTATTAPAAPPTSADVGRRAGVSRTTVSFVLNGVQNQGISEATREKVLAAARELGYEPHAAARSLVGGATGTVGLVVPQTSHLFVDAFLAQVVASVNDECHRYGLKLLIDASEGVGREPGGYVQLARSRRIDGLIVPHPRAAEMAHLQRLREQGVPLVTFGTAVPGANALQAITSGTADLAQVAVRHLLGLGHRRIAYVSYAPPEYPSVKLREQGWREALREAGVRVDKRWVAYANISAESGYQATRELLARGVTFTALFAGNDTIAFGALRALHEAGLRVPEDVAVVGYDDIPLAAFASPPLTSVRTDPVGHGRQAVQMLLKQLGRLPPDAVVAQAEQPCLVVRASCGALHAH